MPKLTPKPAGGKRPKRKSGFPLFQHKVGQWAKKVKGKTRYFGKIAGDEDGKKALAKWLKEKDYLLAGLPVPESTEGLTLHDLCNEFLATKENLVQSGELTPRSFGDYDASCRRILHQFGKGRLVVTLTPADFEKLRASLAKKWGPVAVANEINRIRVIFRFAFEAGLVDKPVNYGPNFKRPSRRILRKARDEKGPRMFDAAELRLILDALDGKEVTLLPKDEKGKPAKVTLRKNPPLRAMVLLGINCGLGNSDCGQMRFRHVDTMRGWLNYPRPKTGVARRAKLWPETIAAIKEAIDVRPEPKEDRHRDLVFITRIGGSWHKDDAPDSPVSKEFSKVLDAMGLKRPGLNFYALRHTLETIGGEARDQVALDHVMGHSPPAHDMASVYREKISDERLEAVADYVRTWIFKPKQAR